MTFGRMPSFSSVTSFSINSLPFRDNVWSLGNTKNLFMTFIKHIELCKIICYYSLLHLELEIFQRHSRTDKDFHLPTSTVSPKKIKQVNAAATE